MTRDPSAALGTPEAFFVVDGLGDKKKIKNQNVKLWDCFCGVVL
jgi:hypothetical protein